MLNGFLSVFSFEAQIAYVMRMTAYTEKDAPKRKVERVDASAEEGATSSELVPSTSGTSKSPKGSKMPKEKKPKEPKAPKEKKPRKKKDPNAPKGPKVNKQEKAY